MRPVTQTEIPPSDDESEPPTSVLNRYKPIKLENQLENSPEIDSGYPENQERLEEQPSDGKKGLKEEALASTITKKRSVKRPVKKTATATSTKSGRRIGEQVSDNYVSYKIRSRGRRGYNRFRGGYRR